MDILKLLKSIIKTSLAGVMVDNQRVLLYLVIRLGFLHGSVWGLVFLKYPANAGMYLAFGFTATIMIVGLVMVFWLIKNRPHHFPGPADFVRKEMSNAKQIKETRKVIKLQIPEKKKPKSIMENVVIEEIEINPHLLYNRDLDDTINNDSINNKTIKVLDKQHELLDVFKDMYVEEIIITEINREFEPFTISNNLFFCLN